MITLYIYIVFSYLWVAGAIRSYLSNLKINNQEDDFERFFIWPLIWLFSPIVMPFVMGVDSQRK